jgi:hypothetical protein
VHVLAATAVLARLGLDDELQEELAWLDSLNKSQPSQGPSAGTHPHDNAEPPELSSPSGQDRLANLLSNIRRNKDRAALQVLHRPFLPRRCRKPPHGSVFGNMLKFIYKKKKECTMASRKLYD